MPNNKYFVKEYPKHASLYEDVTEPGKPELYAPALSFAQIYNLQRPYPGAPEFEQTYSSCASEQPGLQEWECYEKKVPQTRLNREEARKYLMQEAKTLHTLEPLYLYRRSSIPGRIAVSKYESGKSEDYLLRPWSGGIVALGGAKPLKDEIASWERSGGKPFLLPEVETICPRSLLETKSKIIVPSSGEKTFIQQTKKDHVAAFIHLLQKEFIQIVVFDFDQTLISLHTGGRKLAPKQMAQFATTFSQDALQLLISLPQKNIHVAIASFSFDYESVQGVIREALRPSFTNPSMLDRAMNNIYIVIRGISPAYNFDPSMYLLEWGKNPMLDHILAHFQKVDQKKIYKGNLLLIDDDAKNICLADKAGYQTLLVQPLFIQGQKEYGFRIATAKGQLLDTIPLLT